LSAGSLQGREVRAEARRGAIWREPIWRELTWRAAVSAVLVAVIALGASGCGHRKNNVRIPQPQALPPEAEPVPAAPPATATAPARIPVTPAPPGGISDEDLDFVAAHSPILSEVGYATWYTAPYKGRRAANGQVFDDGALTAAHRTLPMGSLVVVTNLKTRQSSAMRITDRGPFVEDRMLDLTIASARAVGVYGTGLALVRMDVYEAPKPIDAGGRWCVQIGAFHDESEALELKEKLQRSYPGANVIEFPGEKSYWVRIRPQSDDRAMAEYILRHVQPVEGAAYLTRLD